MTSQRRARAEAQTFVNIGNNIHDMVLMADAACLLIELYEEQRTSAV